MKYCSKCGAPMNDDSLFCSKCGAKVDEIIQEKKEPVFNEKPVEEKEAPKANAKVKAQRAPMHERKIKEFLPIDIAIVVGSIVLWIIFSLAHPTGIARVGPLLIFMLLSGFQCVISMIIAVKTLKRKIYFKSALNFVFFALILTCFIIDFVFLIQS